MYNALAWDQTALFISVIGLILNGLLVSSIFFSKSLRNQGETILNANLAFSDLLLSIIRVIKYSGILSGAYTDYDKICELEGIFMSTVYTSILTLTSVAVYNYAIIVPESRPQISRRLLFLCSLGLWIIGGAFSVMPVVFGMRFVHHTVTSFCTTTLNTPPTVSMVKLIFDIPVFSTCVVTINYAYGMILRKFSLIHKGMKSLGAKNPADTPSGGGESTKVAAMAPKNARRASIVPPRTSTGPDAKKSSNPQTMRVKVAIIKRAILMTIGFMACWTLSIMFLVYQTFSKIYVPTEAYAVSMILAYFGVIANPMVFFIVDSNYRRALFLLLHLPESWLPSANGVSKRKSSTSGSTVSSARQSLVPNSNASN